MRRLVMMFTLVIFHLAAFCQHHTDSAYRLPTIPLQANHIVYSDTVRLGSAYSKSRLFDNAHKWYKKNFETNDNVLTTDNTETGMISGTGIMNFTRHSKESDDQDILFSIDLYIADGFYVYHVHELAGKEDTIKYSYSDMYKEEQYPLPKPHWQRAYREQMLSNMDTEVKQMLVGLKQSMQQ